MIRTKTQLTDNTFTTTNRLTILSVNMINMHK